MQKTPVGSLIVIDKAHSLLWKTRQFISAEEISPEESYIMESYTAQYSKVKNGIQALFAQL